MRADKNKQSVGMRADYNKQSVSSIADKRKRELTRGITADKCRQKQTNCQNESRQK